MAMPTPNRPLNELDIETLIQFLSTMNNTLMAQSRSANNNLAQLLVVMQALQTDVRELVQVSNLTREKRFEEEIDALEHQIINLQKQVDDKKSAKEAIQSTTDKTRAIIGQEFQKRGLGIDWKSVRQATVTAVFAALGIGVVWALVDHLPEIALWLAGFLAKH